MAPAVVWLWVLAACIAAWLVLAELIGRLIG